MKENKTEKIIFIVFLIMGLLFLGIGTVICIKTFDYSGKIETTGIISQIVPYTDSDGDIKHNVYVKYRVNGEDYNSKLNGYSSSYHVGKKIKIYYYENNINRIGVKSLDMLMLLFPGFGIIFTCIGGIPLIVKSNKKKQEKKLKEFGTRINAVYIETIINDSYTVNGRTPYYIICEWDNPTDNKKYIFKSKNLWINPETIIAEKNIKTFSVYVDMNNMHKYIVDVDELFNDIIDLR